MIVVTVQVTFMFITLKIILESCTYGKRNHALTIEAVQTVMVRGRTEDTYLRNV